MRTTRKSYTIEFKRQVVSLVTEQGLSIPQVCKMTGVGKSSIPRWIEFFESCKWKRLTTRKEHTTHITQTTQITQTRPVMPTAQEPFGAKQMIEKQIKNLEYQVQVLKQAMQFVV